MYDFWNLSSSPRNFKTTYFGIQYIKLLIIFSVCIIWYFLTNKIKICLFIFHLKVVHIINSWKHLMVQCARKRVKFGIDKRKSLISQSSTARNSFNLEILFGRDCAMGRISNNTFRWNNTHPYLNFLIWK